MAAICPTATSIAYCALVAAGNSRDSTPYPPTRHRRVPAQPAGRHLAANQSIEIWKCPGLKLYSRVGESEEKFRARCEQAADDTADVKVSQLRERYAKRIDRLQDQMSSADARVTELEVDVSSWRQTEMLSGVGDLLGGLLKGRVNSSTLGRAASRRAASKKAEARLVWVPVA